MIPKAPPGRGRTASSSSFFRLMPRASSAADTADEWDCGVALPVAAGVGTDPMDEVLFSGEAEPPGAIVSKVSAASWCAWAICGGAEDRRSAEFKEMLVEGRCSISGEVMRRRAAESDEGFRFVGEKGEAARGIGDGSDRAGERCRVSSFRCGGREACRFGWMAGLKRGGIGMLSAMIMNRRCISGEIKEGDTIYNRPIWIR